MTDIVEWLRLEASPRLAEAAAEIERLRTALLEIADQHPYPGMGEGLQEVARVAIAREETGK